MPDPEEPKGPGRKAKKPPFSEEAARIGARLKKAWGKTSLQKLVEQLKEAGIQITNQTLSSYQRGLFNPNDPRTRRTLMTLAEHFQDHFGTEFLREHLRKKGVSKVERIRPVPKGREVDLLAEYQEHSRAIQIEGYIAAGPSIERLSPDEYERLIIPAGMLHRPKLPAFGLRVRGDSMKEDRLFDKDIIVVQNYRPPEKGMIAAVITPDEGGTCKRWYQYGNKVELVSANPDYPKTMGPYDRDTVVFAGLVVGVLRYIRWPEIKTA
jgi:repressor LexA